MQVFLSYAHADRPLAERLRARLSSAGLDVWDPDEEIVPGENWASKVGEALERSQAMVVILSPRSSESIAVRREVEYALGAPNFKGRLIPVVTNRSTRIPWILQRFPVVGPERNLGVASRQIVKILGSGKRAGGSKRRVVKTRRHASTPKPAAE